MGIIDLTLFAVVAGAALEALDIHFQWKWGSAELVHIEVSRQHWGTLTFNPDIVVPDVKSRLPVGVEPWMLTGAVKVSPKDFTSRLLSLLSTVPLNLLLFAVVWIVRKIVRTAIGDDRSAGDPFIRPNVRRLRTIAILFLVWPLISSWSTIANSELISRAVSRVPAATTVLEYDTSPMFVFFGAGILVLVLAEVFKAGIQLREDVEGLV
jgi:hypothetical protein